jgi:hypothetical protein
LGLFPLWRERSGPYHQTLDWCHEIPAVYELISR